MNSYLIAAAVASFGVFALHTFVGGPIHAKALLEASDIHPVPKYTNYYCWHLVTISLLLMAGCFGWAAIYPSGIELAWLAQIQTVAYCLRSLSLVTMKKQNFLLMPQWILFLGIGILGGAGLAA
ncbi:MAG: hypothetical protein JKY57_01515 [Kordiimonadaceae bacterium]|nr:hypothetical protein [Kordiimonadaceae bacterium]